MSRDAASAIATSVVTAEIDATTAHLIPPLLYQGFGYTYTDHSLYTAEGVMAALNSTRVRFFAALEVAANGERRALAMMAMRFCYPSSAVAELGLLLVDPTTPPTAGGQLIRLLTEQIAGEARGLADRSGLRGLVSTEVTIHSLTQRLVGRFRFVTTGVYLGWTPSWGEHLRLLPADRLAIPGHSGDASRAERLMHQRRTETVSVRPFVVRCPAYAVAPPARFAALLRTLYDALKLRVTFNDPITPFVDSSEVDLRLDLRRSLAVIELVTVGKDAPEALRERFNHARDGMIDLIHVVIPLTEMDVGPAVMAMLDLGCVWGALIPFYRGHDAVVLQYLNHVEVDLQLPDLHSQLARRVMMEICGDGLGKEVGHD